MRTAKNISPQTLDNIQALITECRQHVCDKHCPFYDSSVPHSCLIGHPYFWGIAISENKEEW